MFDNEIVKPGEKLKRIRKMLHITQEELAEDICSKNNVSLIENGKQKISVNLAILFTKKFNRIAKEKGINISLITQEELIKDEDSQANNIFINSIINDLKEIETIDSFKERLIKAEDIIEKYNITDSNKIELYKLSANFYYYKHRYTISDQMCRNGLEVSINCQNRFEEANLYIYKSRNSIFTENYVAALEQLECAERLNNRIVDNDLSIMIFYNRALVYKKLGEYDTALKYFKILKKFEIKDQKMLLKIKMVRANCLNEQQKFYEAEKEYIEILDINDKDFIALAYKNLSELYFNNGNYKDAAMCIKDSLTYNKNNEYLNENLFFAAKVLKNLNEDVEPYLLRALKICEGKDRENLDLIEQVIYELVLIYIKMEDEENIMLMTRKVEELNVDCRLIYGELIEYYRERKKKKSIYFNRKSIEKSKQAKKL